MKTNESVQVTATALTTAGRSGRRCGRCSVGGSRWCPAHMRGQTGRRWPWPERRRRWTETGETKNGEWFKIVGSKYNTNMSAFVSPWHKCQSLINVSQVCVIFIKQIKEKRGPIKTRSYSKPVRSSSAPSNDVFAWSDLLRSCVSILVI